LVKVAKGDGARLDSTLPVFSAVNEKLARGVNELTAAFLLKELLAAGSSDSALAVWQQVKQRTQVLASVVVEGLVGAGCVDEAVHL
jgi:hypothetical protein